MKKVWRSTLATAAILGAVTAVTAQAEPISETLQPTYDALSNKGEGYDLSPRGALKIALCTSRAELASDEAALPFERFQRRVLGMLSAQSAMTGKVDLDALLERHFVPRLRAAAKTSGGDFADELLRIIHESPPAS